MRPGFALVLASALAVSGTAAAHITALPAFGPAGAEVRVTLDVINERAGHPMRALTVLAPAGMVLRSGEPLGTWRAELADERTLAWEGGSLAPNATVRLTLVARMPRRTGRIELRAVQHYGDGGRVTWPVALTVTPATGDAGGEGLGAGGAALTAGVAAAVVAASVLVVRGLRRRSLQE